MSLKKTVTKARHAKLDPELQKLYVEKDGVFVLDVEGAEDEESQAAAATKALEQERTKRKEAERKLAEKEAAEEAAADDDNRNKGKVEALETSYKDKLTKQEAAYKAKLQKQQDAMAKSLIDGATGELSGGLFTNAKIGAPHIRSRLTVEFSDDGEPTLRVLDTAGKPSAATLADLKNEFLTNPDFSGIVVGTKASGARSTPNRAAVPPVGPEGNQNPTPFSALPMSEKIAHIKAGIAAEGE